MAAFPHSGPRPTRAADDELVEALGRAQTVNDACTAVVDHLVSLGLPMPSLYLERGDRLRCYAVRGYWQVYDGIPADAGVIGRTYRTGQRCVLRGVSASDQYLEAVPGVVDEICEPIRLGARVVGALNVESTTGFDEGCVDVVARVASAFGHRLAELGGPPRESPAQRLARHVTALTCVGDLAELQSAVLRAALELSGMTSAILVRPLADGLQVTAAAGTVGRRFAETASQEALLHIASWVEQGTSSWSLGDPDGYGFPGHEALKAAGAHAVVVVPLTAAKERFGVLMVAQQPRDVPPTEVVELLELLGAHAGTCLRTLQVLEELRLQASRDPLTGLGHHATYHAALRSALSGRPTENEQVAVVMVDMDGFKSVNDDFGHLVGDRLLRESARVLGTALRRGDRLYRIGGDEFAAVLPVAGEDEAFTVAQRMHAAVSINLPGTTVSVGVAVAAPGEEPASVMARADAALYAVKRAGRDGVRLAGGPELLRPAAG